MNILIIKPSSLGDIIHGLQVAQSIKEQLPHCQIDWVVRDCFAPIVSQCEVIETVFLYHRRKGFKAFLNLIKEIRKKHYDYVLDFQGLARSGLMTLLARATNKIGRQDARECSRLAYHDIVDLPPSGKMSHAVDILLQFLPKIGLKAKLLGSLSYKLSPLDPIDPRFSLPNASNAPIVMIPNSRQAKKEWPYFQDLTMLILNNYPNLTVIWDSHIPIISPPALSNQPNFINTTGKTGIAEMITLIASSGLVIANDSGPMHLAAAMGKEIVGIFGPSAPQRFGPYPPFRMTNHLIQAPKGNLTALSADQVFQTVSNILKKQKTHHLSQSGSFKWVQGWDLNPGPSGYEPDELPSCSTLQ